MDTVPDDLIVSDGKILSEFKPLSEADTLALIQKSSKKTCNLDPMPTKCLVQSLDHLLPVITKMMNSSLLGGHFPKVWKETLKSVSMRKPGSTRQGVIMLKSPISLKLGTNVRYQELTYVTEFQVKILNSLGDPGIPCKNRHFARFMHN